METVHMDVQKTSSRFWGRVGAALAALARISGCSVEQSLLPELREVARELQDRPGMPPARSVH